MTSSLASGKSNHNHNNKATPNNEHNVLPVRSKSLVSSSSEIEQDEPASSFLQDMFQRATSRTTWGSFLDDDQEEQEAHEEEEDWTSKSSIHYNNCSSLEGSLSMRKEWGILYKSAYVILDLQQQDAGSWTCYAPTAAKIREPAEQVVVDVGNNNSNTKQRRNRSMLVQEHSRRLQRFSPMFGIPAQVEWVARDVQHSASTFVVEIPLPILETEKESSLSPEKKWGKLSKYAHKAQELGKDSLRIHFKCHYGSNEKTLWLKTLDRMGRFSRSLHRNHSLGGLLGAPELKLSHSRTRSAEDKGFADQNKLMDSAEFYLVPPAPGSGDDDDDEDLSRSVTTTTDENNHTGREKEYLVYPTYAYPNRWMTERELKLEMVKPSKTFHNLRLPNNTDSDDDEIGLLKVEVLECMGLPALDRMSETDAVVYLVCGKYSFCTDVIWNRLNPIWLPHSRRACTIPIHHGYARLFVGVFDDDGRNEKDDFAGRVVVDLARMRPRSVYDITLPLRLSTHVYSRKPRGSIRLRLSLSWKSDRAALLSYLPKTIRGLAKVRPDDDVTVLCADEKAFRNIALTVHGIHMPRHFNMNMFKAAMREANFARRVTIKTIKGFAIDIVLWKIPIISLYLFLVHTHSVVTATVSLLPAHAGIFLVLVMIRNYLVFSVQPSEQTGMKGANFRELLKTLAFPQTENPIAPLCAPERHDGKVSRRLSRRLLFAVFGVRDADGKDETETHMEFPYSKGQGYPRVTIEESMVTKQSILQSNKTKDSSLDSEDKLDSDDEIEEETKSRRRRFSAYLPNPKDKTEVNTSFGMSPAALLGEQVMDNLHISDAVRQVKHAFHSTKEGWKGHHKGERGDMSRTLSLAKLFEEAESKPLPQQNFDISVKGKKKLTEDLEEINENLHRLTFHLFNDRVYTIRDTRAGYFDVKYGGEDVEAELDRLLNVGRHSSSNPVVNRIGQFLSPLVLASHSAIGLSRAMHNILTWQDPFLSFWVTLGLGILSMILLIFPWRLFLFVVGSIITGPQNYVLRKLDEMNRLPKFIKVAIQKHQDRQKEKKKKPVVATTEKTNSIQPVATMHSSNGDPPPQWTSLDMSAQKKGHYICVPYSQLLHQRFFDWPPQAAYASVVPFDQVDDELTAASSLDNHILSKGSSIHSAKSNDHNKSILRKRSFASKSSR